MLVFIVLSFLVYLGSGQLAGTLQPEVHPPLNIQMCTKNGCSTTSSSVVLDSNWRWTHMNGVASNCYTGNLWNSMYSLVFF
jgi:cellulose 1,4-beta-cellobiosidase